MDIVYTYIQPLLILPCSGFVLFFSPSIAAYALSSVHVQLKSTIELVLITLFHSAFSTPPFDQWRSLLHSEEVFFFPREPCRIVT